MSTHKLHPLEGAAVDEPNTGRVLAIDLAFAHIGWGYVVNGDILAKGCIHSDKMKRAGFESVMRFNARRCKHLAVELNILRREYQPQIVVIEAPHGGSQGATAGRALGMALGIAATVWRHHECVWMAPKVTKAAAEKACRERWPHEAWPKAARDHEHIFDGLSSYILFEKKVGP